MKTELTPEQRKIDRLMRQRPCPRLVRSRKEINKDMKNKIIEHRFELWKSGLTDNEIAEKEGVDRMTIARWRNYNGLQVNIETVGSSAALVDKCKGCGAAFQERNYCVLVTEPAYFWEKYGECPFWKNEPSLKYRVNPVVPRKEGVSLICW